MPIEFTHVPDAYRRNDVQTAGSFFQDVSSLAPRLASIENAGFHNVLIDDAAGMLANMDLAAFVAERSNSIGIVLTHSAGLIAPGVAARQLAALDSVSGGRLSLRMLADPSGADDASNPLPLHSARWRRMDEYLVLLKRLWLNERPIDHEGNYYSLRQCYVAEKGPRGAAIPIRVAGLSGTALKVAGRHADIFELAPGTIDEVRLLIERVKAAAREFGRENKIRFALPVRLVPGKDDAGRTAEGDALTIAVSESPAQLAVSLLPYAELGVSELMIAGEADIGAVGGATRELIRNSLRRRFPAEGVDVSQAARLGRSKPYLYRA